MLTLIYAGFFEKSIRGGGSDPPEKIAHISQTVDASFMKFSDIFWLPILLDLSLFGAKLRLYVSNSCYFEAKILRQKSQNFKIILEKSFFYEKLCFASKSGTSYSELQ